MSENRFTTTIPKALTKVYDDGCILTNGEVVKYINWYRDEMRRLSVENEKLKQENVSMREENEKLRNSILNIKLIQKTKLDLVKKIKQLEDENEQLRKENDRVESLESMFYDILSILANDQKFKKTMKEEMKEYVEEFGIEKLRKELM